MKQSHQHPTKLETKSYVPSHLSPDMKLIFYFFLFLLSAAATIKSIKCNQDDFTNAKNQRQILSTSEPDLLGTDKQILPYQNKLSNFFGEETISGSSSIESTPPLISSNGNFYRNSERSVVYHNISDTGPLIDRQGADKQHTISPHGVLRENDLDTFNISPTDSEPYQLASDYNSNDLPQLMQQDGTQPSNPSSEGANLLDWIEPGSGSGYDNAPFDRPEDLSISNEYSPTPSILLNSPLMTPLFEQMPKHQINDNPPILVKRLPKLVGTAGSPWRYKVPSSTFQDEDGDLRYLRSTLVGMKQFLKSEHDNNDRAENGEVFSMNSSQWLQYDQSSQTLYGFPTEEDIGLNIFLLVASDRWGSSSNETIKIAIRPHQSSRAVTHSFRISGVELYSQRRPSVPEVLLDLVKSITEGVFAERTSKNMVIQSYTMTNTTSIVNGQSRLAISITWFNSSFPIHPCDLTGIELVFRTLVDDRLLPPDWSLLTHSHSEYMPSQSLIKSLSPDYKPSSVGINLLGACESKRTDNSIHSTSSYAGLKIKTRLGKVRWKLGQPIMYRIPQDVFVADGGLRSTRNLSINLHTIDGKTLDQDPMYNFLEFEQESQTIFGLPFDMIKHVGSKELLLTARHPLTDQRVRETFIIDIEPQDLTSINNRAFRVSLYFMTRVNIFGPREQVMLSRRMISALDADDLNHGYEEYADFTVIDIKRFTTGSYIDNSASLSDPANSWKYQDKIFPIDDSVQSKNSDTFNTRDGSSGDGTIIHKLTWTNETIGYRGDCPVEVIRENILYNLERSMSDYTPPEEDLRAEDPAKNATVKFYERLRNFFEPAIDLIHLRFEPMSACVEALDLHDVGNNEMADIVDRAEDIDSTTEAPLHAILTKPPETPKIKEVSPINSDEYWAIVVLIILVVAIFFVVMMLIMGLHTYRINQEKRFELQMKLAQARQNSMYLSSMVLADQIHANDLASAQQNIAKPIYLDERISRKPVILENEKQLLANGNSSSHFYKPTTVKLTGQTVETTSLKPNITFTMDSIADMQNTSNLSNVCSEAVMANQQIFVDERQRSMTLNRRATNTMSRPITRQASANHLSHSQSIITVASLAPQVTIMPHSQANVPFVYTPMPVFYETAAEMPCDL